MISRHDGLGRTRACIAMMMMLAPFSPALTQEELTVENLLTSGWQIAGYTSTFDNRSALILFKHASEPYLVQCLAGYDVTREPRVFTNCYRVR